jgi:tetraacyldisaccharide 4'-kinase
VNAILVNGNASDIGKSYSLVPGTVAALNGAHEPRQLASFRGERVHAAAGIGEPRRFFDMLARAGIFVTPHAFPDHHPFVPVDLEFGDDWPVLMTEKDAVKCVDFAKPGWWSVRVDAHLDLAELASITDALG